MPFYSPAQFAQVSVLAGPAGGGEREKAFPMPVHPPGLLPPLAVPALRFPARLPWPGSELPPQACLGCPHLRPVSRSGTVLQHFLPFSSSAFSPLLSVLLPVEHRLAVPI